MHVRDVMTRVTWFCRGGDTIREAASRMKEHDCGFFPVLDRRNRLEGVVTDRDLALSLAQPDVLPDVTRVEQVMSPEVFVVDGAEDLDVALELMDRAKVRRLVVIEKGEISGVLSLSGLAQQASYVGVGPSRIVETLHHVSEPPGQAFRSGPAPPRTRV